MADDKKLPKTDEEFADFVRGVMQEAMLSFDIEKQTGLRMHHWYRMANGTQYRFTSINEDGSLMTEVVLPFPVPVNYIEFEILLDSSEE